MNPRPSRSSSRPSPTTSADEDIGDLRPVLYDTRQFNRLHTVSVNALGPARAARRAAGGDDVPAPAAAGPPRRRRVRHPRLLLPPRRGSSDGPLLGRHRARGRQGQRSRRPHLPPGPGLAGPAADGRRRPPLDVPAAADRQGRRAGARRAGRRRRLRVRRRRRLRGGQLVARLNRFKIRVKVDVEPLPWRVLCVFGGDDVVGPDPSRRPACARGPRPSSRPSASPTAGRRWASRSSPARRSPAETGVVDVAVDFRKGCYPGQELVERMDSRGATAPRSLRVLDVADGARPGDPIEHDGQRVGVLTSVAGGRRPRLRQARRRRRPRADH